MNAERKESNSAQIKLCTKCLVTKSVSSFGLAGHTKDGKIRFESRCKECRRAMSQTPEARAKRREYYRQNPDLIKKLVRESYHRHREKHLAQKALYQDANRKQIRERQKDAYKKNADIKRSKHRDSYARHAEKNREKRREYVAKNYEKVRASSAKTREKRKLSGKQRAAQREYYQKNKERLQKHEAAYRRKNINRNISAKIRNRINAGLRYGKKSAKTETLLGCSFEALQKHLESQFTKEMNWDALMSGQIHIDHIVPCCQFDLSKPDEQIKCFHFSNLQPLWAKDNLTKARKLPKDARKNLA